MNPQYNQYNFEADFKNFLSAENISPITIKNYLSDLRHFLGWLATYTQHPTPNTLHTLNSQTIQNYLTYMQQARLPSRTMNRRLSTVRRFFSFCVSQGWISNNPA